MGFNSGFKGLRCNILVRNVHLLATGDCNHSQCTDRMIQK